MPGVLPGFDPASTLAGVLMPSVDRVGRYFPLTIAAAMEPPPRSVAEVRGAARLAARVEDVALDALHDDWSIDELEEALPALTPPVAGSAELIDPLAAARAAYAEALAGGGAFVALEALESRSQLASILAAGPADAPAGRTVPAGMALWLADDPEHPQLLVSKGLPATADFIRMFGTSGRSPEAETTF